MATGHIFEAFDAHWRPHPQLEKRYLVPGHHFEWAGLIERWGRLRGQSGPRSAARALVIAGEAGVDSHTGQVLDMISEDHATTNSGSRLWPQTERIKAALLFGDAPSERSQTYLAAARESAAVVERYLRRDAPGLWIDAPRVGGATPDEVAPASSFYHLAGAIDALSPV